MPGATACGTPATSPRSRILFRPVLPGRKLPVRSPHSRRPRLSGWRCGATGCRRRRRRCCGPSPRKGSVSWTPTSCGRARQEADRRPLEFRDRGLTQQWADRDRAGSRSDGSKRYRRCAVSRIAATLDPRRRLRVRLN